jgi:DNA ligase 1
MSNIKLVDNLTVYNPQLSRSLKVNLDIKDAYQDDYNEKINLYGTWYISEKYDGIRAIWTGKKFITRVWREFNFVPKWFTDAMPQGTPLDGEIYIPGREFSYFSSLSIMKSESPKWKEVVYNVFDLPVTSVTFEERLNRLKRIKFKKPFVKIIKFKKLNSIQTEFYKVNDYYKKIIDKDGEGVMLIKGDSLYEGKRSKNSLKYKKEISGEAKVIEYCEGLRKNAGRLGKFKCKLQNGKTFFCGTGFKDHERDMVTFEKGKIISIKQSKTFPKIGDTITFACMEIIKKTGVPRMPSYRGIRHDL